MIVSSKSFKNNGEIPVRHTGFGDDVSPQLEIADAPEETVSFAVILDDLDVPMKDTFTHWVIWNISKTDVIPEGIPEGAHISNPISACQGKAWGKNRYRGPKQPPFLRKEHRYVFRVYALDCYLDIPAEADKKKLLSEMKGHVLSEAELLGRYAPERQVS